jgi:hypothetical protein
VWKKEKEKRQRERERERERERKKERERCSVPPLHAHPIVGTPLTVNSWLPQFGAEHAVGVELDDALVELAKHHASRCGVTSRTTFLTADLLSADVAALCPGYPEKKFTLAVLFLLAEAEGRFMEVAQKLVADGARLLVIAFKLDPRWGLTLAAQDGPVYLYVK